MASKSKIYMVLEFVDGGELFDEIVRLKHFFFASYSHSLDCGCCCLHAVTFPNLMYDYLGSVVAV
jgi:hypothetical protein